MIKNYYLNENNLFRLLSCKFLEAFPIININNITCQRKETNINNKKRTSGVISNRSFLFPEHAKRSNIKKINTDRYIINYNLKNKGLSDLLHTKTGTLKYSIV